MDEDTKCDSGWNEEGPNFRPSNSGGDYRNNRYNNAYGSYTGGYGPPGFRGPPGPPLGFGPGFGFPPKPMLMWGRGFGPGGPPMKERRVQHEDRAIKYLMSCGLAKESVKNLPREFLQFIEPHSCGICGQNFDSFSMSRVHYNSKSHMKNQKKWLSQKPVMGPNNMRKEMPLRSRELYCELCDIEITSRAHADSHYAGKPHRAIVEGRRQPKNNLLLQPGMGGRLEQVLRRERKHLKAPPQETAEAAVKDPKTVSTDLYCNICKIAVTCTEQLTMHLNGKKHLAKEKHYILTMMKGGNNESNEFSGEATATAQEGDEEDNEEGDAETAEDEKKEEAEDSFDWGNGGGNWDEPETFEPDNN
ncbi:unnamed protein product [Chilo suppressalis]|uniref:C2H2-type domain-containing protein n=1 Tax=Chilo suppressalis TaxID=168631 RepID=A0ABN8EBS0_CHISP|nr:unnamed protein product [Chilo suppressalis]